MFSLLLKAFIWALTVYVSIKQLNSNEAIIAVIIFTFLFIVSSILSSLKIFNFYVKTEWILDSKGEKVVYKKYAKFITLTENITQLPVILVTDGEIIKLQMNLDKHEIKYIPSKPSDRFLQVWDTPLRIFSIHSREIIAVHENAFLQKSECVSMEIDFISVKNNVYVKFPKERPPKDFSGDYRIGGLFQKHNPENIRNEDDSRTLLLKSHLFSRLGGEYVLKWDW